MLHIERLLSILSFMESRRIFLMQQYLNHLKNLAMVDHLSERKHYENQDHAVVLIEIKAAGKLFERLMTTKDFMKHSA